MDLIVRNELRKRKMTQKELAGMLGDDGQGISTAYLSDILNGKKDGPKAQKHIKDICTILGIKQSEVN